MEYEKSLRAKETETQLLNEKINLMQQQLQTKEQTLQSMIANPEMKQVEVIQKVSPRKIPNSKPESAKKIIPQKVEIPADALQFPGMFGSFLQK